MPASSNTSGPSGYIARLFSPMPSIAKNVAAHLATEINFTII